MWKRVCQLSFINATQKGDKAWLTVINFYKMTEVEIRGVVLPLLFFGGLKMRSSIMLRIAQEIKFRRNDAHVIDYYNNVQTRFNEACLNCKSHTRSLSE